MSAPMFDDIEQVREAYGQGALRFLHVPDGFETAEALTIPETQDGERLMVTLNAPENDGRLSLFVGITITGVTGTGIATVLRPIIPFVAVQTDRPGFVKQVLGDLNNAPGSFFVGHRLVSSTYSSAKGDFNADVLMSKSVDLFLFANRQVREKARTVRRLPTLSREDLFAAAYERTPQMFGPEYILGPRPLGQPNLIGDTWNSKFHRNAIEYSKRNSSQNRTLAEQLLLVEMANRTDVEIYKHWQLSANIKVIKPVPQQETPSDKLYFLELTDRDRLQLAGNMADLGSGPEMPELGA